jgi:protein-L-isoaspartate(D-aspartate) O-methyltransferase
MASLRNPSSRRRMVAMLGALAVLRPRRPGAAGWIDDTPGDRAARARMVEIIRDHARRGVEDTLGRAAIDEAVLAVMADLPRHHFVPEDLRASAYDDRPLPIGWGQTISQPFIVALMTDMLRIGPDSVVLEIGTGSGYQAAVLARLTRRVHTVEIVPGLALRAEATLGRLGFTSVEVRAADGYYGWPEAAPFDGIMVTAAATHVPPPLVAQLRPGARMVIPVGGVFALQHLLLLEKLADGGVRSRQTLPVRFVPLTGGP